MGRRGLAAVLLATVIAVVLFAVLTKGAAHAQGKRVTLRFLFAQDAAGGSLRGPDDQHLTLKLTGVRDWVTRFDDRPVRAGATVDLRDFLARWKGRFAKSPPNAVLSFRVAGDTRPRDMVLELRDPHYDRATATLTYSARRIRRTTDTLPGTRHTDKPVVYPIPSTFGPASLFIDDADDECYELPDGSYYCEGQDSGGGGDYGGSGGGPAMM